MSSNVSWWESHRPSKRKLVQLYSALLYNAHVRGFVDGEIFQGKAKAVCVPGFNCYSCPGAIGACPLGSIQNALASSGHRIGWYVLGIIMLFGLTLGRTVCGWLCPLGLIQELLHKIPTPKIKKSRVTRVLSYLKYVILAIFVVAIPMWYGIKQNLAVPGFCKYICPAGTLEGAIGLLSNPKNSSYFSMLKILFTRKFVIMMIIGLACVFCYRSFCRFICPLGAIYGMFSSLAVIGVKVDNSRCSGCGACVRSCQMDVRRVGDHECINCAKCMSACNEKAISMKAGSFTLIAPEGRIAGSGFTPESRIADSGFTLGSRIADGGKHTEERSTGKSVSGTSKGSLKAETPVPAAKGTGIGRTAWTIAIVVLCAALIWFNFLDPSLKTGRADSETESSLDISGDISAGAAGTAIGDKMADFSVTCLDGSVFHLEENLGKVVVINMWATYCGPCVQELPHFERLKTEHEGDVAVLEVHASLVTEDVAEFVDKLGSYTIPFAIDSEDDEIYTLAGASPSLLPHTVILDREGVIIYNQSGSVTYDLLDEMYKQAAG